MKRFFGYIFAVICLTFIIPFVLTAEFKNLDEFSGNNEVQKQIINEPDKSPYNYKEYGTIKLKDAENGAVSEISLDEYLVGVVSAEMPANYEIEALKAQSVVART